jgi:CRISPR system Cascade subunit CasE
MTSPIGEPVVPTVPLTVWRSRLDLSPSAQAACGNVQRLHRVVLAGFPPAPGEERVPVLFAARRAPGSRSRVVSGPAGRPQTVLVQSLAQPNWARIQDEGLLTAAITQQVHEQYAANEEVQIRIIANPAYRERGSGKRKAHAGAADQAHWLSRRLSDHGLEAAPAQITPSAPKVVTGNRADGHRVYVTTCEFIAHGTVRDTDLFHRALADGVGQGKAYGCGLLLARRLT